MGEVYRARDTRLKRDVAIKVLPESFAQHPDRLARFRREAELLASLNHPNIAAIYGLEQEADLIGLVLEFVDGETLADQIARGPLARAEALPIARQIAEALEAAHDKGIIHRDLKPANVKVTADGTVKVLDFGLAAVVQDGSASNVNATHSPTLTLAATRAGVILGTAAYMSPEQAAGKTVDKRADIWSFGVVLWELLTGRRLFDGETISHTLADVLRAEIDFTQVPKQTPAPVVELLRRCLDRDTKRRLRDIGEARLVLDRGMSAPASIASSVVQTPSSQAQLTGRGMIWGLALLAGALAIALATALVMWRPWRRTDPTSTARLLAEVGADATLGVSGAPQGIFALSPDGKLLAFSAQTSSGASQLYIRRLDQLQANPLSGTDDARNPFFSPDGQWIGFFAGAKLRKISITGGAAVTICDAPAGRGATWGDDGTIILTPNGAPGAVLQRVSDAGGTPEPLTRLPDKDITQRWPQMLPGSKAVLFTANPANGVYDNANIVVQTLPDGPRKILQRGGTYARYVASGHVVYIHSGTLFAAPFDLDRLEIAGRPVPVLEGVNGNTGTGSANFAVSNNGTFVYLSGQTPVDESPILWMDRNGQTTPLRATPANWSNPRFSPDGTKLAVDIAASGVPAVWIYDWSRDTATRLTFGSGASLRPAWTPDSKRLVFTSTRDGGNPNLFWQRADGTGEAQRLTTGPFPELAGSWHPNGKILAYHVNSPQSGNDIMILPLEGDEASGWKPGKPVVFLDSPSDELEPKFSPDGRWIAYQSNENGQPEIYVRPYPNSTGKWQISTGGGLNPIWSRTRPELLYSTLNQQLMVATYVATGDSFRADRPQTWSPTRFMTRPRLTSYDLHPDGKRFALVTPLGAPAKQDKAVFIFNFFDELRRLAPAK